MEKQYFISLWLDTRRKKENGLYPVRLRVFTRTPRKQKLYPTKFDFKEADFKAIWETVKPRNEHKEVRKQLQAFLTMAEGVAEKIAPFSFDVFEKKLYRRAGDGGNVFWHYQQVIDELKKNNQLGTASNYELSLKSLKAYALFATRRTPEKLLFSQITKQWLTDYERYMLNEMGRSHTTVSIYLRALRTVFNRAIKATDIDGSLYPFGKDAYKVPAVKRVKKSLNKAQLKQLFEANPRTPEQQKAKDFWFFSYSCNGMNIKDIAMLRFENMDGNTIKFLRAKTIRTNKENLKEVLVYLTDFTKGIIAKYGNPNPHPKQYIFPILNDAKGEADKRAKIQNFTRFINQNLKKLAIAEGITGDISTYWARHSFATNAIRQGATMELVSEALSHSNLKTTKGYFAGFEDETTRELIEALMSF